MVTKKQTPKSRLGLSNNLLSGVRSMYLNYFPDFNVKVGSAKYVPLTEHQYDHRSERHWRGYIDENAMFYELYDRQNRRIPRKDDLIEKKYLRHREVSVPRSTYIRTVNKALQAIDDRCAADPVLSWENERNYEFEEKNRALADLARRTRARRRKSGKTSLRYRH